MAVTVLDVNDNAPSFGSSLGLVTVSEAAKPGSLVWAKTASDPDSGLNGAVMYRYICLFVCLFFFKSICYIYVSVSFSVSQFIYL